MPNIRIPAYAVPMILCKQGFSIAIMAESKKGNKFVILGPTEKNTRSLNFCTYATKNFKVLHKLVFKIQ